MEQKISLNHITKIEGHAKLNLGIDNGVVTACELSATEGSRYFEGMVKGRKYFEAHEMTSRICGICSCGHIIAAIQAIEHALEYTPSEQTIELRKLLTLGERIRSHATHLFFLSLPDFLGYESAIAMAADYKKEIAMALRLMKAGNHMVKMVGGRDLHAVAATVGGWLSYPTPEDLASIKKELLAVKNDAISTVELFMTLKYPRFESECDYFSLKDEDGYPINDGYFAMKTKSFEKNDYKKFLIETHKPYSTANFVVKDGKRYMVGALPRINNNSKLLSPDSKKLLNKAKAKLRFSIPSHNPFLQNICQAIELVDAIDTAVKICNSIKIVPEEVDKIPLRAGTGVGVIEVPRGTLWHEYTLDSAGTITYANIITPTAQNLLNMQEDIRFLVPTLLDKKKEEIIISVEKLIRSYDPCFSCSAHFLEVNWL